MKPKWSGSTRRWSGPHPGDEAIGSEKFNAAPQTAHEPLYPTTCSDYFNDTATAPVVGGSGTGAYRGAHADFSSTLAGYKDEKTPPRVGGSLTQILVVTGSGTVSS
ncbi:MAG TPA: hypothetical protein VK425_10860 [Acidimicrobiales bacterium]|nr:hypothetical protein [Acidimicrobiales bacterium]